MALPLVAVRGAYLAVAAPLLDLYARRQTKLEQRRIIALHLATLASELPTLRARAAGLRVAASMSRAELFEASLPPLRSCGIERYGSISALRKRSEFPE
jgi:hypothetical protein